MTPLIRAAVLPAICAGSLVAWCVRPALAVDYPVRQVVQGTHPQYTAGAPGINDAGVVGFESHDADASGASVDSLERYAPDGSATKARLRQGFMGRAAVDSAGTVRSEVRGGVLVMNPDGTAGPLNYPRLIDFATPRTAGGAPALAEFDDYSIYANPDAVRTRIDNPELIDRFLAGYGRDNSPRYTARNLSTDTYAVYKGPDLASDLVLDLRKFSGLGRYTENVRGDVLFAASHNGVGGLFNGPDPVANRVTDNTTPVNATAGLLNDNGQNVLVTGSSPNSYALYAGTRLDDRILGVGDALFGSAIRVLNVNLQDLEAFNNRGEVAFAYTLANGLSGVAVITVPEPGAAALLLLPAVALLRRRR
jgi:hypothetical protein